MKSPIASTLAIIALVSSTIAAPTEASPVERDVSELSKRTTGGVYLCSGSNWQRCDVITYTLTAGVWPCLALPSRFNGHLGSIGPDPGILCRMYVIIGLKENGPTNLLTWDNAAGPTPPAVSLSTPSLHPTRASTISIGTMGRTMGIRLITLVSSCHPVLVSSALPIESIGS